MRTNRVTLIGAAMMMAFSSITANAQLKSPAPSPSQTVKQAFGLGDVTIDYSRPVTKGRAIFGDLVPFGKVWRTGANGATKITFSDDVKFEGQLVKAGTYALYTIPGKDMWEVMLYKDLTLGGNVADYNAANEVLRVKVKPVMTTTATESFTVAMDAVMPTSAQLMLVWDKTIVPIKLGTEIDERMMKNIETALKADSRPYFQAANYYYDNGKDLKQALIYVDKAIEQNPAFYVMHLKAKIQLKMKDNKGAIATAEESMKLAQEAKNDDYVKLNQDLIAKAKKA